MTDRRFKVTVWLYPTGKEIYRNQTSKEATAWENKYIKQPSVIKGVRVENETNLKVVKDE